MDLSRLEENIGYKFKDIQNLKNALTHTSYAYENKIQSNEKLEFLGDSILEFISSEYIYDSFPDLEEGEMTKVRASVVCEDSLYKVAKKHNFDEHIYVGKSERSNGGNQRPAILADSVEAVIAAIYFDGGLGEAKKFIVANLKDDIEESTKNVGVKDYKTVLQEKLQENGEVLIEYESIGESGPDHDKTFTVQVKCNGTVLAKGEGKSKKTAEMQAAQKAIENL